MTVSTDPEVERLPEDWTCFDLYNQHLDWQERGLCIGQAAVFFGGSTREAKETCNGIPGETDPCPVRAECLAYALRLEREYGRDAVGGVWGGMTEHERRPGLSRVGRPCAWLGCKREVMRASDGRLRGKYCSEEHRLAAHREAKVRFEQLGRVCKLPGCEKERGWVDDSVRARGPRTKYCSEEHRREHLALEA